MLERIAISHETADIVVFKCRPAVTRTDPVCFNPVAERAMILESLIHSVDSVDETPTRILEVCKRVPRFTPPSVIGTAPVAGLLVFVMLETKTKGKGLSNDRISEVDEILIPAVAIKARDLPNPQDV